MEVWQASKKCEPMIYSVNHVRTPLSQSSGGLAFSHRKALLSVTVGQTHQKIYRKSHQKLAGRIKVLKNRRKKDRKWSGLLKFDRMRLGSAVHIFHSILRCRAALHLTITQQCPQPSLITKIFAFKTGPVGPRVPLTFSYDFKISEYF